MPTYTPQSSASVGLLYLRGLELLHGGGDLAGVVRYLQSEVPGPLLFSFGEEATPVLPRWVSCNIGSKFFVLIDGSTTFQQVANQIAGYLDSNGESNLQPFSLAIQNACNSLIATLAPKDLGPIAFRYHAGYSFGGAIAEYLSYQYARNGFPQALTEVSSYGAPRTSGPDIAVAIRTNQRIQRWMTDTDPVPLYPPRPLDYPVLLALISLEQARRLSSFVHPSGGTSLKENGMVEAADIPPRASFSPIGGLANWLFSLETDGSNSHSIGEYDRRLVLASGALAPSVQVPSSVPERPTSTDRRQVNRAERATVEAIASQARTQNAPTVIIPAQLDIVASRVGSVWGVYFAGQQICVCGSKRAARATARTARSFLKELQHQVVVEPSTLVQQLTNFLAVASDPSGGFSPVMATTFPQVAIS